MKIIAWNCNMAFRKKAAFILPLKPDILVVPECEHPEKLLFPEDIQKPNDILWFGKNSAKGLGIFSFNDYHITELQTHNKNLRTIVPISVISKKERFNLLAIWAYNPNDKDGRYIEQVWKAVHHYEALMKNIKILLVGDFNSNTIWDRNNRENNHSNLVKFLQDRGIHSTYHFYYKQLQGKEKHPTFYLYRHKEKAYHIDYCFASSDFVKNLLSVEIGDFDFWTKFSDHVPVITTFSTVRRVSAR